MSPSPLLKRRVVSVPPFRSLFSPAVPSKVKTGAVSMPRIENAGEARETVIPVPRSIERKFPPPLVVRVVPVFVNEKFCINNLLNGILSIIPVIFPCLEKRPQMIFGHIRREVVDTGKNMPTLLFENTEIVFYVLIYFFLITALH
jgi:hypothetical protein